MNGRRGNSPPFLIMNIKIPGMMSTSRLLQVSNAYSTDTENIIGFSHEMTKFLARQIVGEEISIMKRLHPEVDIRRLQGMIDSRDKEMNDLAQTMLYNYTGMPAVSSIV